MKKIWIGLVGLVLLAVGALSTAQDSSGETGHGEHSGQADMDHGDMDHGDMGHGKHGAEHKDSEALNVVLVGDVSLTLEPLISAAGNFTLGVRVNPPADLELSVTSPSGKELVLNGHTVKNKLEDHAASEHGEHAEDEEGEDHSEEHSSEMNKDDDSHGEHHSHQNASPNPPNTNTTAGQTLAFKVGAVEAGVWRFSGTVNGETVRFPISLYPSSVGETELYLTLAPSPTLSTQGRSEAFIYAFKDGEPVHSGMTLKRAMAGMQHSTDNEQLNLVHNHFNDLYNETLGYGPMANESPLGFAMAGTWDVTVTVTDSELTAFTFDVEVLDD